jgi:hypothetical protein
MDHVVFFPAHDGTPAFRRVASLEEAVRLVEHLRNAESVDQVGVYALTEVPLAFKAYYKVEVPEGAPAEAPVAEVAPEQAEPVPVPVPVPAVEVPAQEQPVVALAASNGETVSNGSMGFFAS